MTKPLPSFSTPARALGRLLPRQEFIRRGVSRRSCSEPIQSEAVARFPPVERQQFQIGLDHLTNDLGECTIWLPFQNGARFRGIPNQEIYFARPVKLRIHSNMVSVVQLKLPER